MRSLFKCQNMLKFFYMTSPKTKKKVQVIILCGEDVLLLKLAENRGGFWQNVTGGVDIGEDFFQAAQRELEEETGYKSYLEYIPLDFEFVDQFGFQVIEKVFFTKVIDKEILKISHEHQEVKWMDIKLIKTDNYKYHTNYLPIEWLKNR